MWCTEEIETLNDRLIAESVEKAALAEQLNTLKEASTELQTTRDLNAQMQDVTSEQANVSVPLIWHSSTVQVVKQLQDEITRLKAVNTQQARELEELQVLTAHESAHAVSWLFYFLYLVV